MTLKYLITGATGGLGGGVLQQISKHVPKSNIAASSSRPDVAERFKNSGMQFRHADYQDRASLENAFAGVEKLLFVSANAYDNEARNQQHRNVIEAAKSAGVGHVCEIISGSLGARLKAAGILHIACLGRPFFQLQNRRATSALRLRSNAERVSGPCSTTTVSMIH